MLHFALIMFMRGRCKAVADVSHAIVVDQQRPIDLVMTGLQNLTGGYQVGLVVDSFQILLVCIFVTNISHWIFVMFDFEVV